MKSRQRTRTILAAASLAACVAWPATAHAFDVTYAHGRSTSIALRQWAADIGYAVIWQVQNSHGLVDFAAPSRDVHDDFHTAVQALVSGALYDRANVYCAPPMEFQAEAIIDDRMRIVYVVGRPTGRRCVVP